MIKGIFLDVDGVLVGNKKGYNWPDPNTEVLNTLKKLRRKGIIVSLCTGKGTFAIKEIALKANLDNLHIGDGGAIIKNFINNEVFEINPIDKLLALDLIKKLKADNIYTELYLIDKYIIESKNASDPLMLKHADILYRQPFVTNSLEETARNEKIIKIMPIPKNAEEKKLVIKILNKYKDKLSLQWGIHLTALPTEFGVITNSGISKGESVKKIASYYNFSLQDALGVGDGITDWGFIKLCGYKGIMRNSSRELINKVTKSNEKNFIGGNVNENGLLDILKYYKLF